MTKMQAMMIWRLLTNPSSEPHVVGAIGVEGSKILAAGALAHFVAYEDQSLQGTRQAIHELKEYLRTH